MNKLTLCTLLLSCGFLSASFEKDSRRSARDEREEQSVKQRAKTAEECYQAKLERKLENMRKQEAKMQRHKEKTSHK
jgi:hypothetical protein